MGDTDPFPFVLARDLGRTVGELDPMPFAEYVQWKAFYVWETAMAEFELQKAKVRHGK